jgi:hypothetical protein
MNLKLLAIALTTTGFLATAPLASAMPAQSDLTQGQNVSLAHWSKHHKRHGEHGTYNKRGDDMSSGRSVSQPNKGANRTNRNQDQNDNRSNSYDNNMQTQPNPQQ